MLQTFADYVAYTLFGLLPNSHLGAAVDFFIYDTIKIFMMLATIIFLVSLIRSFFPQNAQKRF